MRRCAVLRNCSCDRFDGGSEAGERPAACGAAAGGGGADAVCRKKQGRHGAGDAACGAPQPLGVGCQHRPDGSERGWAERELLAADAAADRVAGDAGADRILGAVGGIGSGRQPRETNLVDCRCGAGCFFGGRFVQRAVCLCAAAGGAGGAGISDGSDSVPVQRRRKNGRCFSDG